MKLFIFGYGYSARAIARHLAPHCRWIAGTSRSSAKLEEMEAKGIDAFFFDGEIPQGAMRERLNEATHILISIAPDEHGDPVLNSCADIIAANGNKQWLGYLSTVGVYGDHGGAWVTEETECRPVSKRSTQRVAAESAWQSFASDQHVPLGIYRLAGIYGPGRNQMLKLAAGTCRAINKPGQVFNRIHVEDIAQTLAKAATTCHEGLLNVCDDEPAPPQEVIAYCADLMGIGHLQEIDFDKADMTPMARSFYGENKRCGNEKMRALIDGPLHYPTYREAFTQMWQSDSWRG
ncbi:SDR family oxidoreductase [uncultured Cohaesibacter sp.]|uniref:SDR family oxidoreductase n=1 Tax=uncultured Cohaesibacter sp. TaxID=1002546 RepID=UPI00292E2961|nr:SDR family oxidoreductase [uncultured Cohaesibacter sp.]